MMSNKVISTTDEGRWELAQQLADAVKPTDMTPGSIAKIAQDAMSEVVSTLNLELERLRANLSSGVGGHESHTQESTAAEMYKRQYGNAAAQAMAQGNTPDLTPKATALGAAGMASTARAQRATEEREALYADRYNRRGTALLGRTIQDEAAQSVGDERRSDYLDGIKAKRKAIDAQESDERARRKRVIDYQVQLGYVKAEDAVGMKAAIDKEYADLEPRTSKSHAGMAKRQALYDAKFNAGRSEAKGTDEAMTGQQWAERLRGAG